MTRMTQDSKSKKKESEKRKTEGRASLLHVLAGKINTDYLERERTSMMTKGREFKAWLKG